MVAFLRISLVLVVLIAALLQAPVAQRFIRLIHLGLAIGKDIQPITDFQHHQCRRLRDPLLEACEDMWMSGATRTLYLACSDAKGRQNWMPNEAQLNLAGRSTRDRIVALNLDTLDFQPLRVSGFTGTAGDGLIHVLGFTGVDLDDRTVELYVTNFRPSVDPATGQALPDQTSTGANATIEVFKVGRSTDEAPGPRLDWVRTIADEAIRMPNRVAVVPGGGIYVTNDHGSHKIGLRSRLSPLLETGSIAFCPAGGPPCEIVSTGHAYPNGLIHSRRDERVYVPCSAQGGIKVLKPCGDNGSLELEGHINVPFAIDNLSEDEDGVIWAAAITHGPKFLRHIKNPFGYTSPSTVLKVQRTGSAVEGYEYQKVVEDRDGEVLPGTTTVVHDVPTGRLFMSSGFSPFIAICEQDHEKHRNGGL